MRKRSIEPEQYYGMLRRMIAAAGRRVAAGDVEELQQLRSLTADLDNATAAAVAGLRSTGNTWESIGAATGTTRQAAIMKWAATRSTA